jgi:hypothetical protein
MTLHALPPLSERSDTAIELGQPVSVYAWSSGGPSAHKVHRSGGSKEGPDVIAPACGKPTGLAFLLLFPAVLSLAYGERTANRVVEPRAWVVFLAAPALDLRGVRLLTRREPGVWSEPLGPAVRLLLRYGALAESIFHILPPGSWLRTAYTSPALLGFTQRNVSLGVTLLWSGLVSLIAFKLIDLTIGLRVNEVQEREGLDTVSHGERAYNG